MPVARAMRGCVFTHSSTSVSFTSSCVARPPLSVSSHLGHLTITGTRPFYHSSTLQLPTRMDYVVMWFCRLRRNGCWARLYVM